MNPDFQKWLEKLDDKLDRQTEAIHNIDKTLAKQEENLKEHIRRTELAEENIQLLRKELKPVQNHVAAVGGVLKAIGILATIITITLGIIKLIEL